MRLTETPFILILIAVAAVPRSARAQCSTPPIFDWVGTNGGEGAPEFEEGLRKGVSLTADGDAIVFDSFQDIEFDWDPTSGIDTQTGYGRFDIVLNRVSGVGERQWKAVISGEGAEGAWSGVYDKSGQIAYCGSFWAPEGSFQYELDFDPTSDEDIHRWQGDAWYQQDIFISKLIVDPSLQYGWTVVLGGLRFDSAEAIFLDSSNGDILVAGTFADTVDFDPGDGTDEHRAQGQEDAFLLKLSATGQFLWARTFGGPEAVAAGRRVAVDSEGNAYVAGEFFGTVDFDPGPGHNEITSQMENYFVSKFDREGNYLWTRVLDTNTTPWAYSMNVDDSGRLLVAGWFEDTVDFDPTDGIDEYTSQGDFDAFLTVWSKDGEYLWTRVTSGVQDVVAWAEFAPNGGFYMVGNFAGTVDFNPDGGGDVRTSNGDLDAYLLKLDADGGYEWTLTWGGPDTDFPMYVTPTSDGDVWVAGVFKGTSDFDPGEGVYEVTTVGERDHFLLKLKCPDSACDDLVSHKARGKAGKVISKVRTDLPRGRVTVECAGDAGTGKRSARLNRGGKAKLKIKNLAPGIYTCAVTKLKDADNAPRCKGRFQPVDVVVE